ncbi:MAG: nucleotide exchange factor GrpE [Lachnospiraceae bacterium]|nr:nucleotide exchange factor GrpE [Lachnospiraceae bacterium]MEE0861875.1 nucleotide exchange factor GrpE [Lachnospiraceae bacterium]
MAKKEKAQAEETMNQEATVEETNTEAVEATEATETAEETKEEEAATEEQPAEKDKKDILIEELNDKYMRTFAEFDNFRKRSEKEKAAMFEVGAKSIIEKILPIVDSFERGLGTLSEEEIAANPFADGMDKVYKQMVKALEEVGVTPIEAVGKEFDPNLHNAVMHGDDDQYGENIVSEEFQKGYMYRDTVVRYSMVKVEN